MNQLEFLVVLSLVGWGWGVLVLTRLHDARAAAKIEAAEANYWHSKADAEYQRAERLGQELIAAHVPISAAERAMADAFAQRADMQRRLAQATWPNLEADHG